MDEKLKTTTGPEGHPGYETSDAEVKPILGFLLGLALLMAVAMGLMALLFNTLESHYQREAAEASPLVDTAQIPPGPRLQTNAAQDLAAVREWENQRLHSYEWVDRDTGVFRIPIERAMEIVSQNGLPARERH